MTEQSASLPHRRNNRNSIFPASVAAFIARARIADHTVDGEELVREQLLRIRSLTDRGFALLMGLQWIVAIVVAFYISPLAWQGSVAVTHPHVWAALVVGGIFTVPPVLLALFLPSRTITRQCIAIGQILMAALCIHLMHGRIETHFYIFVSLAFLAFYIDPWVLLTATAVVIADHYVRGVYYPQSVFGPYARVSDTSRLMEHIAWVIFMDLFLFLGIRLRLAEARRLAEQQAYIANTNLLLASRTEELATSEEQFRQLADNIRQVFLITDTGTGKIVYVSPAHHTLWRRDLKQDNRLEIEDLFQEREQVRTAWLQARNGIPAQVEASLLWPDGECRFVRIEAFPVTEPKGQIRRIAIIVEDITERKRAEVERVSAYRREHRIAVVLQESLLIRPDPDAFPGLAVETFYQPAREDEALICGDFFDVFSVNDGKIVFVVGDVSGKGLDAATHMTRVKYALRAYLYDDAQPASVLAKLNRLVWDTRGTGDSSVGRFVALSLAVVHPQTGLGSIARAGTEPALIWRETAAKVEELEDIGGLPIGVLESTEYEEVPFSLSEGDILTMVTDGITEARNRDRQIFGMEGLIQSMELHLSGIASLRERGERILQDTTDYAGGKLADDVCCLLVRRQIDAVAPEIDYKLSL